MKISFLKRLEKKTHVSSSSFIEKIIFKSPKTPKKPLCFIGSAWNAHVWKWLENTLQNWTIYPIHYTNQNTLTQLNKYMTINDSLQKYITPKLNKVNKWFIVHSPRQSYKWKFPTSKNSQSETIISIVHTSTLDI